MALLYVALLHFPVYDKNGDVVTSAVTNMDIHDIARSGRTFGVRRFYVVTPVHALRELAARILDHWETGHGAAYNRTRKDALEIVRLTEDLERHRQRPPLQQLHYAQHVGHGYRASCPPSRTTTDPVM